MQGFGFIILVILIILIIRVILVTSVILVILAYPRALGSSSLKLTPKHSPRFTIWVTTLRFW